MRITFLGTAAAEGYPNVFCRCKHCEQARILRGPSLRKRSSVLINDDLLIDLGPDITAASYIHSCSLTQVCYCLQTHAHSDHLDPSLLLSRSHSWGVIGAPRLHFFASPATLKRTAQMLEPNLAPASLFDPEVGEQLNLEIHQIEPLEPYNIGSYEVVAFPANHDLAAESLLYAITTKADNHTIFYGTDTGTLLEETWQAFHYYQMCFNVVILDHTYKTEQHGKDHLNAKQFVKHVAQMRQEGLLTRTSRVFATHLSPETISPHPYFVDEAVHNGYEVAYDGLTIETNAGSNTNYRNIL